MAREERFMLKQMSLFDISYHKTKKLAKTADLVVLENQTTRKMKMGVDIAWKGKREEAAAEVGGVEVKREREN